METKENLKPEENQLAQEELTDLAVDDTEQATQLRGGRAIAGIVVAATSDN